jgi:hypothetical protein
MVRTNSPQAPDTKDSEIDIFEFLNFVLFVTFVVNLYFASLRSAAPGLTVIADLEKRGGVAAENHLLLGIG